MAQNGKWVEVDGASACDCLTVLSRVVFSFLSPVNNHMRTPTGDEAQAPNLLPAESNHRVEVVGSNPADPTTRGTSPASAKIFKTLWELKKSGQDRAEAFITCIKPPHCLTGLREPILSNSALASSFHGGTQGHPLTHIIEASMSLNIRLRCARELQRRSCRRLCAPSADDNYTL